jgi:hypothetical protein
MIYLILVALATLIYAGAWMAAAPSKALTVVNKVSNEVGRFDRNIFWQGSVPLRESGAVRVAFRFMGLALILLSVMRLKEII